MLKQLVFNLVFFLFALDVCSSSLMALAVPSGGAAVMEGMLARARSQSDPGAAAVGRDVTPLYEKVKVYVFKADASGLDEFKREFQMPGANDDLFGQALVRLVQKVNGAIAKHGADSAQAKALVQREFGLVKGFLFSRDRAWVWDNSRLFLKCLFDQGSDLHVKMILAQLQAATSDLQGPMLFQAALEALVQEGAVLKGRLREGRAFFKAVVQPVLDLKIASVKAMKKRGAVPAQAFVDAVLSFFDASALYYHSYGPTHQGRLDRGGEVVLQSQLMHGGNKPVLDVVCLSRPDLRAIWQAQGPGSKRAQALPAFVRRFYRDFPLFGGSWPERQSLFPLETTAAWRPDKFSGDLNEQLLDVAGFDKEPGLELEGDLMAGLWEDCVKSWLLRLGRDDLGQVFDLLLDRALSCASPEEARLERIALESPHGEGAEDVFLRMQRRKLERRKAIFALKLFVQAAPAENQVVLREMYFRRLQGLSGNETELMDLIDVFKLLGLNYLKISLDDVVAQLGEFARRREAGVLVRMAFVMRSSRIRKTYEREALEWFKQGFELLKRRGPSVFVAELADPSDLQRSLEGKASGDLYSSWYYWINRFIVYDLLQWPNDRKAYLGKSSAPLPWIDSLGVSERAFADWKQFLLEMGAPFVPILPVVRGGRGGGWYEFDFLSHRLAFYSRYLSGTDADNWSMTELMYGTLRLLVISSRSGLRNCLEHFELHRFLTDFGPAPFSRVGTAREAGERGEIDAFYAPLFAHLPLFWAGSRNEMEFKAVEALLEEAAKMDRKYPPAYRGATAPVKFEGVFGTKKASGVITRFNEAANFYPEGFHRYIDAGMTLAHLRALANEHEQKLVADLQSAQQAQADYRATKSNPSQRGARGWTIDYEGELDVRIRGARQRLDDYRALGLGAVEGLVLMKGKGLLRDLSDLNQLALIDLANPQNRELLRLWHDYGRAVQHDLVRVFPHQLQSLWDVTRALFYRSPKAIHHSWAIDTDHGLMNDDMFSLALLPKEDDGAGAVSEQLGLLNHLQFAANREVSSAAVPGMQSSLREAWGDVLGWLRLPAARALHGLDDAALEAAFQGYTFWAWSGVNFLSATDRGRKEIRLNQQVFVSPERLRHELLREAFNVLFPANVLEEWAQSERADVVMARMELHTALASLVVLWEALGGVNARAYVESAFRDLVVVSPAVAGVAVSADSLHSAVGGWDFHHFMAQLLALVEAQEGQWAGLNLANVGDLAMVSGGADSDVALASLEQLEYYSLIARAA